jgi:hypothetical protein
MAEGDKTMVSGSGESGPSQPVATPVLDEAWLQSFYRECGRELSLAYATLNQLTNWAIVVVGALFSGLAFGSAGSNPPRAFTVAGLAIAYAFVLRFFFRSILAYINVTRWNKLQSSCARARLLRQQGAQASDAEATLVMNIQQHYLGWISPVGRKAQIFSNLHLSFSLLFVLPSFFLVWGLVRLWADPLVRGIGVFVVGITVIEITDFFRSPFFDDIDAARKKPNRESTFPAPVPDTRYVVAWAIVLLISVLTAFWTKL